ncbi:MAG: Bbp16 family capsid cement protein [Candidatus Methanospirareceae archaeon]
MINDAALMLDHETVAVTSSQATADYVDFDLVAPDKGTYTVNTELIFIITTTGTGASGTYEFILQGDSASNFSGAVDLASSGAIAATSCTKGKQIRLKIPAEHGRYLRGYVTVGGSGAGALTFDAHLNHLV